MRLDVERSGGVAGRTVRWSLDVDALDPDRQAEVHDLLSQAAGWPGPAGPDRFCYRVVAHPAPAADVGAAGTGTGSGGPAADSQLDVRFAEPLPDAARRLLEVVRAAGS
ncbi:MAG TPA: protealysin inhibitor emfourin [Mycobacteriales bacterium]|nr:protealysin inhibitor emfourin [Mycobacteriales bacterium]